jgi:hypothetical protein
MRGMNIGLPALNIMKGARDEMGSGIGDGNGVIRK